ncbi:hypothetical protein Q4583_15275 [Neptunomonas phycophila]|uniref:STY0301 family protein n=1 Tax=Neptunomonas phycophila TaxID=1572645 RepID=UPI0026E27A88|nr:STY0301 family protein [Neptunomonas phycophila]MDO6785481.1 hypothetical protein [Neptunomonas phycophila]
MNKFVMLALLSSPLFSSYSLAHDGVAHIECPESISTAQVVESADESFSAFTKKGANYFLGIGVTEGSPDQEQWLRPEYLKEKDIDLYDLSYAQESVWVVCQYANTSVTLAKELERASACEVPTPQHGGNAANCRLK